MADLLVIDDDPAIQQIFKRVFEGSDVRVFAATTAAEALKRYEEIHPDVVVLDIMLPDDTGLEAFSKLQEHDARVPVIFVTADDTSGTAIEAMKAGAYDYLLKPLDFGHLRDVVARAVEIRRLMRVPVRFDAADQNGHGHANDSLVGRCAAMQEVYKAIGRVAPQNVTVLVHGESGTGKELVARAIYQHSQRSSGRFLAVNCAAIPETLLESELFGHEKGSFTGADAKRIGKFEQCSGGTLFLDEIGDMTPLVQSKVLRVLQEQQFERVGGNETIKTDVRIIAATNRDLDQMVADGRYRADLYYRLNGFAIKLPPLRERSDDIIGLVEHFLGRFNRELGKDVVEVAPDALELMMRYSWPGNVRELQSVLKQALLQATGPVLLVDFLPTELRRDPVASVLGQPGEEAVALAEFLDARLAQGSCDLYAESLAFMERLLLTKVLDKTAGNQSQAARILGITRGSLRNKIRQLNIAIDSVIHVRPEAEQDEPAELAASK